ncbi:MAG: rhamnulose-1-phosphate aldolase [Treponema sp.]|jgi:rhamnulose-1-phosphate aldolase|nr:rhamnulose-1-phosphate aldolase [Treponema sp.]
MQENSNTTGITGSPTIGEIIRICSTMYRLGWNERNGGNISMIINEDEVKKYLDTEKTREDFDLHFDAGELEGKLFAVTRTGSYFRNMETDPAYNLGIIRINRGGRSAGILWGLTDQGRPTSELSSHLRSHIARLRQEPRHRIVMHSHAVNTVAMTYVHPLDEREFTRSLWRMETECIIVFPEGVGVLPWMICGNDEIGQATAEKMERFRVCVWAQHGIFAAGSSIDEAFGLIETVEKAAQIYLKVIDKKILNTISDSELKLLAETFKVPYRKDFLD